jgi:hypothetical protein
MVFSSSALVTFKALTTFETPAEKYPKNAGPLVSFLVHKRTCQANY